jgi:hypothetical protein
MSNPAIERPAPKQLENMKQLAPGPGEIPLQNKISAQHRRMLIQPPSGTKGPPVMAWLFSVFYPTYEAGNKSKWNTSEMPKAGAWLMLDEHTAQLMHGKTWTPVFNHTDGLFRIDLGPEGETVEQFTKRIHAECLFCKKSGIALFPCKGCEYARYCSEVCQKSHWLEAHHKQCNAMKNAFLVPKLVDSGIRPNDPRLLGSMADISKPVVVKPDVEMAEK